MTLVISREEFAQRQQLLFDGMQENSVALLFAAPVCYRNRDAEYPYRQDSDFYYLTGFEEPESIALFIKQAGTQKFIIFCRPKDAAKERWDGVRLGTKAAISALGANEAYAIGEAEARLPALLAACTKIYHACNSVTQGKVSTWLELAAGLHSDQEKSGPISQEEIGSLVHAMRRIKSPTEIALMQKAADITCDAHAAAMRACKPGLFEYVLEATLLEKFYREGSRFPAYSTIVGGGANACTLHYIKNTALLKEQTLVLIDAGAEYASYAADVTRTFPVSGTFTAVQKQLYELVLAAQLAGIDAIAPDKPFQGVQEAILAVMVPGLVALGILKGDVEAIIQDKSYQSVYMHGSGHWLGLDVHDVGLYHSDADKQNSQLFIPGMTLTVEPGIYIAEDNQDVEPQWRGLGIRIEDDILVTENGYENLTQALPKTVDAIEQLMA